MLISAALFNDKMHLKLGDMFDFLVIEVFGHGLPGNPSGRNVRPAESATCRIIGIGRNWGRRL
jgi:hypothetical protein